MSRAGFRALGGLLAILVAWSPLFAQRTSALEAGVGVAYFPADDRLVAGPSLRGEADRDLAGARTHGEAAVIAGGGAMDGSVFASAWWRGSLPARSWWQAGGEGSALFASRLHASESMLGGVRVARGVGGTGAVWLRGTSHVAWREAGALRGYGLEAGTSWALSFARFSTSVLHERAQGQLFAGNTRDRVLGVVPVGYDEASLAIGADEPWGTLDVMAGARRDPDAEQLVEPMWRVSALLWQTSTRAVSVNVARQPADFIHGADATYSLSLGIRFSPRAMATDAHTSRPVVLLLASGTTTGRYLRVRAPRARTVEVMADFTGWDIVPLVEERGSPMGANFALPQLVAAGTHHVMLRIDGGPWMPPANLPQIGDDYGGRVGILVVE